MQLQQDNKEKIIVTIKESTLEYYLKTYFGWRKNPTYERFKKLGSKKHDEFIKYLQIKGF
jgi:hypothetical protein